MSPTKPTRHVMGHSGRGEDIERWVFSQPSAREHILFLGGVHGDEIEGVELLRRFLLSLETQKQLASNVHVVPCLNGDGYRQGMRVNARGVDLNRNLPTRDWTSTPAPAVVPLQALTAEQEGKRYYPGPHPASEPENQALISLIQERLWKGVISVHSYEFAMVNYNGKHSEALATFIAQRVDLPAKADIGYPTPGSLGTWVGLELKMPCITLEVPKGMKYFDDWEPWVCGLLDVVQNPNSW